MPRSPVTGFRGAGVPADRAGPGRPAGADDPAAAHPVPGGVRLGNPAERRAGGDQAAHDRRDPDCDDERPSAGAAGATARGGHHVSTDENVAGPVGPEDGGTGRGSVLNLASVSLSFGGLRALSELNLQVGDGEIVSLIGPNGAGKTTVFNVITGVYEPSEGDVVFAGNSIAGLAPHSIAQRGIARTFQTLRLFLNMSVMENVLAATYGNTKAMPWES